MKRGLLLALRVLDISSVVSFTTAGFFGGSSFAARTSCSLNTNTALHDIPRWEDLSQTMSNLNQAQPSAVNGNIFASQPSSKDTVTLYRERHGWCPYSERIWLALETKQIDYDTIYIDNIYGRPNWYYGNTPQIVWDDGRTQSESMDLVREADKRFPEYGRTLYPKDIENEVINKIRAFDQIFPSRTRPSSRAAFLFRYDGEPLWKNEFEKVLHDTDELLSETSDDGPFFCGERFTAADIAWAPFLERYAAQLPCFHDGLNPRCAETYPHLSTWYTAMEEQISEYSCKVQGDASSWRKVLKMAGYGNAGVPPLVSDRMDDANVKESQPLTNDAKEKQKLIWTEYSATRPWVASTASEEAASVLIRNRELIVADVLKQRKGGKRSDFDLPTESEMMELDEAMRSLATILCQDSDSFRYDDDTIEQCKGTKYVKTLAAFLDHRMCVPRDMGTFSAASIKRLASSL